MSRVRMFPNWRYITEYVPTGRQIACYAHDAGHDVSLTEMVNLIARWNAQGNTWRYWISNW